MWYSKLLLNKCIYSNQCVPESGNLIYILSYSEALIPYPSRAITNITFGSTKSVYLCNPADSLYTS